MGACLEVPFITQNSHVVGFVIGVSRPTTLTANVSPIKKMPYSTLPLFSKYFQKIGLFLSEGLIFQDQKYCKFHKNIFFKKKRDCPCVRKYG